MDQLQDHVLTKLRESRAALLRIAKEQLTGSAILQWLRSSKRTLEQAETISHVLLVININGRMGGFWEEDDPEVCLMLRTRIVELLDHTIKAIDSTQVITPVLDDLIRRVADIKLATLLREFNESRSVQPNLACAGFRTILPLIIRERAKRVDPTSQLATKGDIGFEPDIRTALAHASLFSSAEQKLLRRYVSGGDKDSFDNVVHKPDFLIDKAALDDSVDLLNHLLPTIVD